MQVKSTLSPSLVASQGGRKPGELAAMELKFVVSSQVAGQLQQWAETHMAKDPFSNNALGGYQVTSVYFDTPNFDIFHKNRGFVESKYRLRRYGLSEQAHAEHKLKEFGKVWKRRETVATPVSEWTDSETPTGLPGWFAQALEMGGMRPACIITYQRIAYLGDTPTGPVRMTLDRYANARSTSDCRLDPVLGDSGRQDQLYDLLAGQVIVELKFLGQAPPIFQNLIRMYRLTKPGPSKYRTAVAKLGLAHAQPVQQAG